MAKATPTAPAPSRNRASSASRTRFTEKNRRQVRPLNLSDGSDTNSYTGPGSGSSVGMPGSDGVLKFLPSSAKACLPAAVPLYDDTALWLVSPAEPPI